MSDAEIAKRIRFWRQASGMSVKDLADRIGVTKVAVHYWERGSTTPSHANLMAVATACGITMRAFWGDVPEEAQR